MPEAKLIVPAICLVLQMNEDLLAGIFGEVHVEVEPFFSNFLVRNKLLNDGLVIDLDSKKPISMGVVRGANLKSCGSVLGDEKMAIKCAWGFFVQRMELHG